MCIEREREGREDSLCEERGVGFSVNSKRPMGVVFESRGGSAPFRSSADFHVWPFILLSNVRRVVFNASSLTLSVCLSLFSLPFFRS